MREKATGIEFFVIANALIIFCLIVFASGPFFVYLASRTEWMWLWAVLIVLVEALIIIAASLYHRSHTRILKQNMIQTFRETAALNPQPIRPHKKKARR